jgi:hypothetical protein
MGWVSSPLARGGKCLPRDLSLEESVESTIMIGFVDMKLLIIY